MTRLSAHSYTMPLAWSGANSLVSLIYIPLDLRHARAWDMQCFSAWEGSRIAVQAFPRLHHILADGNRRYDDQCPINYVDNPWMWYALPK